MPKQTLYLLIGLMVGFDLLVAAGVYYWFVVREPESSSPTAISVPSKDSFLKD